MVHCEDIQCQSDGRGFTEITAAIAAALARSGVRNGLLNAFIRHTSAALVISENADPQVLVDLERFMGRLVPDGDALFDHVAEGVDDMPAHVRSVLTHSDLSLPVRAGQLALGTWQGVYLWEHRRQPHRRVVSITIVGDD